MKKKLFSPALITVGLLFLADPSVSLFNLLPDSIGYLLIVLALSPLAETVPHFAEARDSFRKLMLISLLKLPCGFLTLFVMGSGEIPMVSVIAFVFAALDFAFLLGALKQLFEAYATLATEFSVEEAFGGRRISWGGARVFTCAFFLLRAVGSALPTLCLVGTRSNLDYVYPHLQKYGAFAVLATFIVLVVSIAWLSQILPYVRRVSRAVENAPAVLARRTELSPMLDTVEKRNRVRILGFLLSAAALCSADIWLDDVNYLPDAVMGAILITFIALTFRWSFVGKWQCAFALGCTAGYTLVSLGSFVIGTLFASSWDYTDLGRKKLAGLLFRIWEWLSIGEAVLGAVMLVALCFVFRALVQNATGFSRLDGSVSKEGYPMLYRRSVLVIVAGALTVLFEPMELYLRQFTTRVEANPEFTEGFVTVQPYGGMWFLSLVLSLLFFAMTLYFTSGVQEGSKNRFKL